MSFYTSFSDIDEYLLGHHDCKDVDVSCKNTIGGYVYDCGSYLDYRNGRRKGENLLLNHEYYFTKQPFINSEILRFFIIYLVT